MPNGYRKANFHFGPSSTVGQTIVYYSNILTQIQVIFTDDLRKMTESEENVLWMFI